MLSKSDPQQLACVFNLIKILEIFLLNTNNTAISSDSIIFVFSEVFLLELCFSQEKKKMKGSH